MAFKPIGSLILGLWLASSVPAQAACGAERFVINAGNAFMAAARSGSPKALAGAASRYADLRSIALFALGPHRKSLPKSREAEYVALTRSFIGSFMARHKGRIAGSGLKVVSCTGKGTSLVVKAKSSGGNVLVFRIAKGRSGYRVQDVSVSSFWLASQMRSNFVSILNKNGGDIDAIFRYLKS